MRLITESNLLDGFVQAATAAESASCLKARCGSIIVSASGEVIGSGFNAPPLNEESQRKCSAEHDMTLKPKSDKTCCVHAEWNAILDALLHHPTEVAGSTLFFMRVDENENFTEAGEPYCTVCSRLALQAGVSIFGLWNNGPQMIPTDEYNLKSYSFSEKQ